jgi:hypothetical protein
MLTLLLASANAAPGEERPVAGSSLEFNKEDGTLYIDWSGPIVAGMAAAASSWRMAPWLPRASARLDLSQIDLRMLPVTLVVQGMLVHVKCSHLPTWDLFSVP